VPQDWARAAAIYYEAYQERSAEAMFNLGFMHEFGAGVPQDLPLARKFYLMTSHTMPDARYAVQVRCRGGCRGLLGWRRGLCWGAPARAPVPSGRARGCRQRPWAACFAGASTGPGCPPAAGPASALLASRPVPRAPLAPQVALCWLRLHELWEALRPLLPRGLDFIWRHVFVVRPPYTSPLGALAPLLQALVPRGLSLYWQSLTWRASDALSLVGADLGGVQAWLDAQEVTETATLLALLALLFVVLRLRRRRAEQLNGQAAGGGAAQAFEQPPRQEWAQQHDGQ
jgi:hypothetical protein